MIREQVREGVNGIPVLILQVFLSLAFTPALILAIEAGVIPTIILFLLFFLHILGYVGFFMVAPNQAKVLQLFGEYSGSVRIPGLRWANPFYTKRSVSLRVRNFDTNRIKVNDKSGNPIEIGAVVVWKVVDSAEAIFEVDDFEDYVEVQSEAALRNLATKYPYDQYQDDDISLSGNTLEVSKKLEVELTNRLGKAGVKVIEARISHLAYAPEIAAAMLQRQQASAVVAARTQIVEGAVGMVDLALDHLKRQNIIDLDDERKAAMVSNLMVVLCSDRHTQPVINTGSLYN